MNDRQRRSSLGLIIAGILASSLVGCAGAGAGGSEGNGSSSTFNATSYEYVEAWGATDGSGSPIEGTGADGFKSPTGLVIGADGHIYITDKNNHNLKVYDATGDHVETRELPTSANLVFPTDIAYDEASDTFVITGNYTSEVYFVNTDGSPSNPTAIYFPEGSDTDEAENMHGVAVDSEGDIYVAEVDNHRIKKFTRTGAVQGNWGATDQSDTPISGTQPGEFDRPYDVEVHQGKVFVVDSGNSRIQVFDTDGVFLEQFESPSDGGGQFSLPRDIALDPAGNRYIATLNDRVLKFNKEWVFLTAWGSNGDGPAEFENPEGLIVDSNGRVLVADERNHRIQVFRPVE